MLFNYANDEFINSINKTINELKNENIIDRIW